MQDYGQEIKCIACNRDIPMCTCRWENYRTGFIVYKYKPPKGSSDPRDGLSDDSYWFFHKSLSGVANVIHATKAELLNHSDKIWISGVLEGEYIIDMELPNYLNDIEIRFIERVMELNKEIGEEERIARSANSAAMHAKHILSMLTFTNFEKDETQRKTSSPGETSRGEGGES